MKHILIGDLHTQDNNIVETDAVIDYIINDILKNNKIDSVTLLGDWTHQHNIVRQSVSACIRSNVIKLKEANPNLYYVVGNHDNENPRGGPVNAADLIMEGVGIKISGFTGYERILNSNLYIVGFRHQDMFIETCKEIYAQNPNSIILAHQTIDGSKYESGMPAIGGIVGSLLPNKMFIQGHVHTKQSFDRFFYVGSPRALTFSDVNQDKGIHIFDDETLTFEFISLNHITKCFYSADFKESDLQDSILPVNPAWKAGDDIKLHIHGSSDFFKKVVEANKELVNSNLGKISFIPHIKKTTNSQVDSKEVETDIFKAFEGYVFNVYNADADMRGKIWEQMTALSNQTQL